MIFSPSQLEDLLIVKKEPKEDDRGSFARAFAKEELSNKGIDFNIVHVNQGFSKSKGTLRGLHYQTSPKEEQKLFQCLRGKVFDVTIDMREESPTYLKWFGIELSFENQTMIYIPKGFAHGYQTLEDNTLVEYMVTEYYSPENEKGIRWNDPKIDIKWPIEKPILSEKDQNLPLL